MSAEWHYFKDGERVGPVSEEKLTQLVQEGRFLRTDKLWKDGMADWTDAVAALPALFAAQPPPLPTEAPASSASLVGRALKLVLDEKWQEFLEDAWKAWRARSALKKSLVILIVVTVLSITLWGWFARAKSPNGEEPGMWSRLWDSGLITGCAGLVFAYLKRKLENPDQPPLPSGEAGLASVVTDDGPRLLGLSRQQWLALLVALFIPTLLASLVSSFLVGSQVHLWLTGPLLLILGMAILVLSVELNKNSQKNDLAIGVMVGGSALVLYGLTCINTPWVLLFYTLIVIFPTLHLFTVARQGSSPFRLSASLLTGFGVIGLALALGITALPRNQANAADRDESEKLIGTWAKDQKTLTFTKGGSVNCEGGILREQVAKFKFNGAVLTLYDDRYYETKYHLDLTTNTEMLLGSAQESKPFGEFSVLEGRWSKGGSPDGEKKPGGKSKASITEGLPTEAPAVDSEFASNLVGEWELTEGERIGTVQFTKGGMVVFNWHWDTQPEGKLGGTGKYRFVARDTIEVQERQLATRLGVDMASNNELILVKQSGLAFTGLEGRLRRVMPKPPPTSITDKRLVGKWEIVEGDQKGSATFTEEGTVMFARFHRDLKRNLNETGKYTLTGKSLKIKASGENGGESVREIEFLSDDELLVHRPKGLNFTWLYGRLKRVK